MISLFAYSAHFCSSFICIISSSYFPLAGHFFHEVSLCFYSDGLSKPELFPLYSNGTNRGEVFLWFSYRSETLRLLLGSPGDPAAVLFLDRGYYSTSVNHLLKNEWGWTMCHHTTQCIFTLIDIVEWKKRRRRTNRGRKPLLMYM